MPRPTPLARYVADLLTQRGEMPEEFADRIKINSSGFYKFLRGAYKEPRQANLKKIAEGFGMTVPELLRAVEAQTEDDPFEQAIRQRTPEMREAVRDIPREFWGVIIKSTFDRAIEGARDMASLLTGSVTSPSTHSRIRHPETGNAVEEEGFPQLPACKPNVNRPVTRSMPVVRTTVMPRGLVGAMT